jgi:hypothetical protein
MHHYLLVLGSQQFRMVNLGEVWLHVNSLPDFVIHFRVAIHFLLRIQTVHIVSGHAVVVSFLSSSMFSCHFPSVVIPMRHLVFVRVTPNTIKLYRM